MLSFAANPVRVLAGTDPGRARLINATSVAISVLLSTGLAWLITKATHADGGYLTVGAFLAMQMGLSVRDATARARLITTVLLAVPVIVGLAVPPLLSHFRYLEIAAFVILGGIATWMRRFGARWSSIGMVAFFSSFFALFLKPALTDLGPLLLIGLGAVAANLVVRLVLLTSAPTRSLRLLMREFRGAGDTALRAAATSGGHQTIAVRKRLDRVGDVAVAITDWQDRYDTAARTGLSPEELSRLVFDARTDLVQASLHLSQVADRHRPDLLSSLVDTLHQVLSGTLSDAERDTARRTAREALDSVDPSTPELFTVTLLARSINSQVALQTALIAPDSVPPAPVLVDPDSDLPDSDLPEPTTAGPPVTVGRHRFWHDWSPTSRMAVQVMLAAAIATVAGEAISASRWYWSVLTAFLVFVGVNTRAAILTRAYRRVFGTLCGVVVGLGLGLLLNGAQLPLMLLCVLSVFCMLYFGPLNYAVMAFFVTVLLSMMYGLLGILNRHLLEVRVEETLVGAAIGVACAFLVFSRSSRPELSAHIQAYFAAIDTTLARSGEALVGEGPAPAVVEATNQLYADHRELENFVESMWISFAGGDRRTLRREATVLLDNASTHADRLAQEAIVLSRDDGAPVFTGDAAVAVRTGIEKVRAQADAACRSLLHQPRHNPPKSEAVETFDAVGQVPFTPHTPQYRAMLALSNLSISMQHIERLREHD